MNRLVLLAALLLSGIFGAVLVRLQDSSSVGKAWIDYVPIAPNSSVHHLTIPGMLRDTPGVLHIFAKGLRVGNRINMRAFLFFEQTVPPSPGSHFAMNSAHLQGADLIIESQAGSISLTLHTSTQCLHMPRDYGAYYDCVLQKQGNFGEARFPEVRVELDPSQSYSLTLAGWLRRVSLQNVIHTAQLPEASDETSYSIVLLPSYGIADIFPKIISKYVDYHAKRGITSVHLYSRPDFYFDILKSPVVRDLIAAGLFKPLLWQELAIEPNWQVMDHPTIFNHAILNAWGTSVRLLLIDLDEYLVLPKSSNIQEAYMECLAPFPHCALLRRYTVFPANRTFKFWEAEEPIKSLVKRKTTQHYFKSLIHPHYVNSFFIHEGAECLTENCTMYASCQEASADCAWIAHYVNLLNPDRFQDWATEDDVVEDVSWQ